MFAVLLHVNESGGECSDVQLVEHEIFGAVWSVCHGTSYSPPLRSWPSPGLMPNISTHSGSSHNTGLSLSCQLHSVCIKSFFLVCEIWKCSRIPCSLSRCIKEEKDNNGWCIIQIWKLISLQSREDTCTMDTYIWLTITWTIHIQNLLKSLKMF